LLHEQWVIKEIREEIKKWNSMGMKPQPIRNWDIAKEVQRGKFIAMSAFIQNTGSSQINDLMLAPKCLEKQEQEKPQTSRNNKNKGQNQPYRD
jgi:hypothetical protein